jgi:hypothetical protein
MGISVVFRPPCRARNRVLVRQLVLTAVSANCGDSPSCVLRASLRTTAIYGDVIGPDAPRLKNFFARTFP